MKILASSTVIIVATPGGLTKAQNFITARKKGPEITYPTDTVRSEVDEIIEATLNKQATEEEMRKVASDFSAVYSLKRPSLNSRKEIEVPVFIPKYFGQPDVFIGAYGTWLNPDVPRFNRCRKFEAI